jgi:predicted Rdx family selenoprotein
MSPIFKTMLNLAIWILFFKGLALIPVTLYIAGQALSTGGTTLMMVGLASCAAGTFAFTMACVIIWIKHQVE